MGILTVLFNRQIMRYLGADALAVYGLIINVSTFVQCCAYSMGQASQPIISTNFGAKKIWKKQRNSALCCFNSSILRNFLDCFKPCFSESLYPHFYDTDTAHFRNCACDYQNLRAFILDFAVQYFFYILFPVNNEAESGVCRFCFERAFYKRNTDFYSAAFVLVFTSGNRSSCNDLRCCKN